jgi:protein-S-isoprenylcysteine O-methyltransferase Ste14
VIYRIHVEEHALIATLGHRYRTYASHHKRLGAYIW